MIKSYIGNLINSYSIFSGKLQVFMEDMEEDENIKFSFSIYAYGNSYNHLLQNGLKHQAFVKE